MSPAAMDIGVTDWIGFGAAALTTAAFVPQAWLTFRSGDTRGISLGMYATFTAGVALWLAYGVCLGSWPVIAANAVTLTLAACILAMKVAGLRRARRERNGGDRDGSASGAARRRQG